MVTMCAMQPKPIKASMIRICWRSLSPTDVFFVTEDFDFGDLLIRDKRPSHGAIVLFLPKMTPGERADRLVSALKSALQFDEAISIVEPRRIRSRRLTP